MVRHIRHSSATCSLVHADPSVAYLIYRKFCCAVYDMMWFMSINSNHGSDVMHNYVKVHDGNVTYKS